MRVMGGKARGRRIKSCPGREVRPTPEKVKGAVFSMLGDCLEGKIFLDLFAGTGNMGLESLSRGTKCTVFIEKKLEYVKIIYENLELTGLNPGGQARVLRGDALKGIQRLYREGFSADYIFVDPPYFKNLYLPVIQAVAENQVLKKGGKLIVEHFKKHPLPQEAWGMVKGQEKKYGDTLITFYARREEGNND